MPSATDIHLLFIVIHSCMVLAPAHFIVRDGRVIKDPCRRTIGVEWVRDPESCNHYYICVAGRPVKMPPCPDRYVWSEAGRNCVPEISHWNDCPLELIELTLQQQQQQLHHGESQQVNDAEGGYTTSNSTSFAATSDRMDALVNKPDPAQVRIDAIKKLNPNHPCVFSREELILPHPKHCHWYYNCSLTPQADRWLYHEPLTQECPYPQLFSLTTRTCQHYQKVDCGKRVVKKQPCEYRENQCLKSHCRPCNIRFANCSGRTDGNHTFPLREWTPKFVMCQDERMSQLRDCADKTPIFSPISKQCEPLHNVPKVKGGLQPLCEGRHDGLHADETGRCDYFFECRKNKFIEFSNCGNGFQFDPETRKCRESQVAPPCGNTSRPLCRGHQDGMYADPYGRCPMYYHCKGEKVLGYLKCPFGSFSPSTGKCEMTQDLPAPCGSQINRCFEKLDGVYPDHKKNCMSYFRCRGNYTVQSKTCSKGLVFNHVTGDCDDVNNTPPPCGMAPSCIGKKDGRYPSPLKGCQYFYTCREGRFLGYDKCSILTGGFYFNPQKQQCDFPKNICGPCGVRTVNCNFFSAFPL